MFFNLTFQMLSQLFNAFKLSMFNKEEISFFFLAAAAATALIREERGLTNSA